MRPKKLEAVDGVAGIIVVVARDGVDMVPPERLEWIAELPHDVLDESLDFFRRDVQSGSVELSPRKIMASYVPPSCCSVYILVRSFPLARSSAPGSPASPIAITEKGRRADRLPRVWRRTLRAGR